MSAREYTQDELLHVLCGESSEAADRLIADCRDDDALAGRVRRLAEFDSLLQSLGDDAPRSKPSPDALARYIHAPDSLDQAERMALRVHLAVNEDVRRDRDVLQHRPQEVADRIRLAANAAARAPAPVREQQSRPLFGSSRARLAAVTGAILFPLLGYASYSVYQEFSAPSVQEEPNIVVVPREPVTPTERAPAPPEPEPVAEDEASEPLIAQTEDAAAEEGSTPSAPETSAPRSLDVEFAIAELGVTNPEEICMALEAGPWQAGSDTRECGEALLAERFDSALTEKLSHLATGALPIPDPHLQVAVLRTRLTQDGTLRIRGDVEFPDVAAGHWKLQAAFHDPPELDTEPASHALELDTALLTHPAACDWAAQNELSICEFYSRFAPTLIEELPEGPVWVLTTIDWHQHNAVRVHVTGYSDEGASEHVVFLEKDEDPLPHWTVLAQTR